MLRARDEVRHAKDEPALQSEFSTFFLLRMFQNRLSCRKAIEL